MVEHCRGRAARRAELRAGPRSADRAEPARAPVARRGSGARRPRLGGEFEPPARGLRAARDDCEAAPRFYRRSRGLAWQRGDVAQAVYRLEGVATASAGLARPELTLRLPGAVDAAYTSVAQHSVAFWLSLKERWYALARARGSARSA